jgi:DNA-binding MarR family transcriptional regulator
MPMLTMISRFNDPEAWRLLPPAALKVYMTMAFMADDDRRLRAAGRELADRTGMDRVTIVNVLKILEDQKMITRLEQGDRGNGGTLWSVKS